MSQPAGQLAGPACRPASQLPDITRVRVPQAHRPLPQRSGRHCHNHDVGAHSWIWNTTLWMILSAKKLYTTPFRNRSSGVLILGVHILGMLILGMLILAMVILESLSWESLSSTSEVLYCGVLICTVLICAVLICAVFICGVLICGVLVLGVLVLGVLIPEVLFLGMLILGMLILGVLIRTSRRHTYPLPEAPRRFYTEKPRPPGTSAHNSESQSSVRLGAFVRIRPASN